MRLRKDYLRRRLNWTEENGNDEMLILLEMKLADSSAVSSGEPIDKSGSKGKELAIWRIRNEKWSFSRRSRNALLRNSREVILLP